MQQQNPDHKAEATSILIHYFKASFEKCGLQWTPSNDKEVAKAVEHIMIATLEEMSRAQQQHLEEQMKTPQPCNLCGKTVVFAGKPVEEIAAMHDEKCPGRAELLKEQNAQPQPPQQTG